MFAGCVLLLLGQYGLMFLVGEPYPALCLPGFSGTGYEGDIVAVPRITFSFESNGQVVGSCQHSALLERLPRSYRGQVVRNVFSPRKQEKDTLWHNDSPSPTWSVFLRLCPGFHRAGRTHQAGRNPAALQKWLRKRAEDLVPDAVIDTVVVRWEAIIHDMRCSPPTPVGTSLTGELTIPLETPSAVAGDIRRRDAIR